MSTVVATFTRIERALWVVALLSLVGLLALGMPLGMPRAMPGQGGMPWEWIARVAVALLGITALVVRACLQPGRRRVAELCARVDELEAEAAASTPATRPRSAESGDAVATLRSLAADLERRARAAEELARAAEGEATREAASLVAALDRLREAGALRDSIPLDGSLDDGLLSRVTESAAALAVRLDDSGALQELLSQRALELVSRIEVIAASQASVASALSALEGLSDRGDALAVRCARTAQPASEGPEEIASELAGIAQGMAAAIASVHAALSAAREASSRAVLAAREHAREDERGAQAERELATIARALEGQAVEAASAIVIVVAQGRGLAVTQAGAIAKAVEELSQRRAPAADERRPSDEIEDLAREAGRLQAMIARLGDPRPQ